MEWLPYELHPEIPKEGIDWSDRGRPQAEAGPGPSGRAGYFDHLRALAEEEGLTFQPPTRAPNSHRSLEAAEFAREHGVFDAYNRALFEAYFSEGRDIGDVDVLAELGSANGLDPAALRDALDSLHYALLVDERTEEARRLGVSSTPTFIFKSGDQRLPIVGAQEYALFQNVARRMGATPRAE